MAISGFTVTEVEWFPRGDKKGDIRNFHPHSFKCRKQVDSHSSLSIFESFYRVILILIPTQFIEQGSHSFGFRLIISREKQFPVFATFRGHIDAKFLHANITRACPLFWPATPY
jgi:hypothetical protein